MTVWQWDPSLYAGSADYYANGRMPYPPAVTQVVRETLALDGTGRLLDVGCGPGTLTLMLAGLFAGTVGVDADPDLLAAAAAAARDRGIEPVSWRALRAEELPADLGRFRVVTFAQSFHWFDQDVVAAAVAGMLEPGGAVVHLGATTDKGTGETPRSALNYPQPPWAEIHDLVVRHLGSDRRAGQGLRPRDAPGKERKTFSAAGFTELRTVQVPNPATRLRTADEIVAAVYSLSYSAPHLFGDHQAAFEAELRSLLAGRSAPGGLFAEQVGSVELTFWRAPEPSGVPAPAKRAAKATAPRKAPARKASGGEAAGGEAAPAKPAATRKTAARTSPAKQAVTKKAVAQAGTAVKKTVAKKAVTKKAASRRPAARKGSAADPDQA